MPCSIRRTIGAADATLDFGGSSTDSSAADNDAPPGDDPERRIVAALARADDWLKRASDEVALIRTLVDEL